MHKRLNTIYKVYALPTNSACKLYFCNHFCQMHVIFLCTKRRRIRCEEPIYAASAPLPHVRLLLPRGLPNQFRTRKNTEEGQLSLRSSLDAHSLMLTFFALLSSWRADTKKVPCRVTLKTCTLLGSTARRIGTGPTPQDRKKPPSQPGTTIIIKKKMEVAACGFWTQMTIWGKIMRQPFPGNPRASQENNNKVRGSPPSGECF